MEKAISLLESMIDSLERDLNRYEKMLNDPRNDNDIKKRIEQGVEEAKEKIKDYQQAIEVLKENL